MNVASLDKTKCSGCELCANVCAKQCIELKPDELGYLIPTVDAARMRFVREIMRNRESVRLEDAS